jgi:hypothetical protein
MFSYSVLLGLLAFSSASGMCFFIPELTFVGAMVSFGTFFYTLGTPACSIGGLAGLACVFFAWSFFFPFVSAMGSVLSFVACVVGLSETENKTTTFTDLSRETDGMRL